MQGKVFKIHSDFYYVNTGRGVFECKTREILKKQKAEVVVGDIVELEQENFDSMQAFILKIVPRKNFITRPKAANITQAIIVSALKEPTLDFEQLNRYIAHCEYHSIKPVLCFNKNDLLNEDSTIKKIKSIYEPLGYTIIFTSALEKIGIAPLKELLKNNTSIFCGSSGVGKSSIINIISAINIKTKEVSEKTGRGVHTTRHCEIIPIDETSSVVDTPGFSHLKFNFLMPYDVQDLFKEIKKHSKNCKFSNCLHKTETDCNVIAAIGEIDKSRYDSYIKLVNEAMEFKTKITYNSQKTESRTKENKNKIMTKISAKKRNTARKTNNQKTDKYILEQKNDL
ncbi:MAG: ribosome small subunit-dependent GTPase A [Candidatus Gastranaerophilales bacterium]|nr:ribosome small subunit-dependent GTPase A [Candidatus Gastranaerophilales bacterium]